MQNELRRQISLLKREVEECELEEKQERNRKKNPNHELINTLAEYSQNHQRYIENIEIILRQLDNQIVSPYNVLDLIDGVDEYLKSYREEASTWTTCSSRSLIWITPPSTAKRTPRRKMPSPTPLRRRLRSLLSRLPLLPQPCRL